MSDNDDMPFDALIANPGRLKILTALAVDERQEFVDLRRRTNLTDGNLAAHAKRLHTGGLIQIEKQFKQGKPVTSFVLTVEGRKALETHARRLISALSQRRLPSASAESDAHESQPLRPQVVISDPLPIPAVRRVRVPKYAAENQSSEQVLVASLDTPDDEWVD